MNELIQRIKFLFTKPRMSDGCVGIGNTDSDFLLGSVENLSDILAKSEKKDTIVTQWNQNKNWWSTMFCTAVAPICAIASIFNRELSDIDMYKYFLYAKKEYGYKAGVGNEMKNGVDCARNYWNSTLAKEGEQVLSFLTNINSSDAKGCFDKLYGLVFCYSGNRSYNEDKKDRLLSGTNFGAREYGHCTMLRKIGEDYWVYDSNKGDFDDKYKVYPGNLPELLNHNWYKEAYVFLPMKGIQAKPKTKLQIYLENIRLAKLKK